ncbi:ferredoxin reductase [Nonomuraea ceibae]|uniref:ferredoxin reductase n=1 Tax=Nonomuraea ceibae TaxID=1935170 RepID=UPI001C5EED77|nr:ferredoxin reductase [Nonomuraea ceibae]
MTATPPQPRVNWQAATITGTDAENARTRTLQLQVPGWPGHQAGQHVDVRLTAENGYQATRAYSLAGAPGEDPALTVVRAEGGEVSPYLVDVIQTGDQVELRGPIGGYFVWKPGPRRRPVLLLAGGSGVVPLRAMLRHRARLGDDTPMRLLYSVRSPEQVIYRRELAGQADRVSLLYTRTTPPGWPRPPARLDHTALAGQAWPPEQAPLAYVCGPTTFVEHAAGLLTDLGYTPADVRTERYG